MLAALAFLGLVAPVAGGNGPAETGWEHFYNLEYDQAILAFEKGVAEDPADPGRLNWVAQAILYREMFRSGALESELVSGGNAFLRRPKMNPSAQDQKRFDELIGRSLELSNRRLAGNPKDTGALYALGVAHGLRANYNWLVRKAWLDSLRDATAARKAHNKVTEIDPELIDARMVQGLHDYVVGSLPWTFKILGFLVGYRGDREAGIRTLRVVAEKGSRNRSDAAVLLAAIYRRERRPKEAIPLLQDLIVRFPRNYLLRFELAQMYSDLGEGGKALETLEVVERLKREGAPGYGRVKLEKILFARGVIQFWYKQLDQAEENLERVAQKAGELDLNTASFAWLRLGQTYDLTGRRRDAVRAYREAVAVAPQSDAGKEARRYQDRAYSRR